MENHNVTIFDEDHTRYRFKSETLEKKKVNVVLEGYADVGAR